MKKERVKKKYSFKVRMWLYPGGTAAWHFITVPKKKSADIQKRFKEFSRGWGSLPVEANMGKTIWKTSIFPDRKSGTYLLPIKKEVRRKEGLYVDDEVAVKITILP